MDRILAWIVGRLRWLPLAAVVGGAVFVYLGWTESSHIRQVLANGVEATAQVEGGTHTRRRRGSDNYALKLSWRDGNGNVRSSDSVSVPSSFARKVISGDHITIDSVRIKYLPDAPDTAPVVLDANPEREADSAEFMVMLGVGLFGAGAVASLIMFLLSRRRRHAVA